MGENFPNMLHRSFKSEESYKNIPQEREQKKLEKKEGQDGESLIN